MAEVIGNICNNTLYHLLNPSTVKKRRGSARKRYAAAPVLIALSLFGCYSILELFACLEAGNLPLGNHNPFAGEEIAPLPCRPHPHSEHAEAGDNDLLSAFQSVG